MKLRPQSLIVGLIFFAVSAVSLAEEKSAENLVTLFEQMNEDYIDNGAHNNYLESVEEVAYQSPVRIIKLHELEDLKNTLEKCVFADQSGFDGNPMHLSQKDQSKLVNHYAKKLWLLRNDHEFAVIKAVELNDPIWSTGCGLSIKDNKKQTIVIQGQWVD